MTTLEKQEIYTKKMFTPKEPISALTHLLGAIASIIALPILLIHATVMQNTTSSLIVYTIYMFSMILLYSASTIYHSLSISFQINYLLKKIDHMMVFVLIAGSYTPIAWLALQGNERMLLLSFIWIFAIVGMAFKFFFVTCPKYVSSIIYTCMGWICIFFVKDIYAAIPTGAFLWLLAGGIIYTIGAIIYAMKPKFLKTHIKGFGNHEVFHCFVLAGSICHFICIYSYMTLIG